MVKHTGLIKKQDIIESIANALQYISYYHSPDFIKAMRDAYEKEQGESAKDAIKQILYNSRLSAIAKRPICQDTGIAVIFVKAGMNARYDFEEDISDVINEGVRQAYLHSDNKLRASVLRDPAGKRTNTGDNTPAVIHYELTRGHALEFIVAAKGGGSENKARFANLNPSDDICAWVLENIKSMGAGWCPPGILGIGIGGTPEKAMLMAKKALMEPVNIHALIDKTEHDTLEALRLKIYQQVNQLGIGAQGLGGITTVLDVKIKDYPTHAASLPIAMIPNCAATRHIHFSLSGQGAAAFKPPAMDNWPDIKWEPDAEAIRVNLDTFQPEQSQTWQPGQRLLLSGKLYTARDAAHKKLALLIEQNGKLPDDIPLKNKFIYYVGPVDAIEGEIVGPAGPTTSTRMDKYTELMLSRIGIAGMIGKAERGKDTIEKIKQNRSCYLIAVGGAAYLISQAIKKSHIIAFPELGMEAIYEFEVEDMPVTVAVNSLGQSIHQDGPSHWQHILQRKS